MYIYVYIYIYTHTRQIKCKASVFIGEVGDVFKPLDITEHVQRTASMEPWKFKLLAPELFFFNFSTTCIYNVKNTGTKYVRIMKQTAF